MLKVTTEAEKIEGHLAGLRSPFQACIYKKITLIIPSGS